MKISWLNSEFPENSQPWPAVQKDSKHSQISVSCVISNFHSEFAYCTVFIVYQTVSLYFCVFTSFCDVIRSWIAKVSNELQLLLH